MSEKVFETLVTVDVNKFTEKKNGLVYLTWSHAWDRVKRLYPEASYTIWKGEKGLPYVYDPLTGYMVYTSVTIDGVTHEMWLPVMDGANKAMKAEKYSYQVKGRNGQPYDKWVEAATMFDINKTIMRCLVKNLAMFGLGLYIYAGEDLPTTDDDSTENKAVADNPNNGKAEPAKAADGAVRADDVMEEAKLRAKVLGYVNKCQMSQENINIICNHYKIKSLQQLTAAMCKDYLAMLERKGKKVDE